MDLRHIETPAIRQAIMHIIDTRLPEPLYNQEPLTLTPEAEEFIYKHLMKLIQTEDNYKARFIAEPTMKKILGNYLESDEGFLETSKAVANHYLRYAQNQGSEEAFDLCIVEIAVGEQLVLAGLRLDYVKTYSHDLSYKNDQVSIQLIAQETSLIHYSQSLKEAFLYKGAVDAQDYDLLMVDKSKTPEMKRVFSKKMLCAEEYFDPKIRTKKLKDSVELWTRKNLKDDLEVATQVRQGVNEALLENAVIDLEDFTQKILGHSAEAKLSLAMVLEKEGVKQAENLEIDKNWVAKKMTRKMIYTNTGFMIKGDMESFDDKMVFEMRPNGDGTVDYIIKNVRSVKER
jgi:hypothetical protein